MDHQTFAQILGNYGEFVGAIAVVATLAYLAYQINQNTKAMKSTAYREVSRVYADHNWDIARDRDLAELMMGQLSDTGYEDPVRTFQSSMALRAFLMRVELLYNEVELGIGPRDRWDVMRDLTRAFLDEPKVREMWESDKFLYGKGFVGELENASLGSDLGVASEISKGRRI